VWERWELREGRGGGLDLVRDRRGNRDSLIPKGGGEEVSISSSKREREEKEVSSRDSEGSGEVE